MSTGNKLITGSIQVKNGALYAVIAFHDEAGKRKQKWVSTGFKERGGKTAAKEYLRNLLNELNDGKTEGVIAAGSSSKAQESCTEQGDFGILFIDFLRDWLPTKRLGKKPIDDTTYKGYETLIENHIARFLGKMRVNQITPDDIEDFYKNLIVEHSCSSCTALHHHRLLAQAVKYGVKKKIINQDFMFDVEAPADSSYQADYYQAEEAVELIKRLEGKPLRIPVLLALYYGFRRSEIIGLRWSSVDFVNMRISIDRKVVIVEKNGVRTMADSQTLKTERSRRSLPLIPEIAQALMEEKARQEKNKELWGKSKLYNKSYQGHVCVDSHAHIISPDKLTAQFKSFLKKEGLKEIRFHDLRHTNASLLAMANMPLTKVSAWLGHSNTKTTERYAHLNYKAHDDVAATVQSILSGQTADRVESLKRLFSTLSAEEQREFLGMTG